MYELVTLSGSVYTIHNGRLTRQGDEIRTDPGIRMVHIPFATKEAPTAGRQWHFTVVIDGQRKDFATSVVTTVRKDVSEVRAA